MPDLLKMIYAAGAGLAYYEGFRAYQSEEGLVMVASAMACALCLILFVRRISSARYLRMSLKKIDKLSGTSFEKYLMVQFRRMGYRVSMTSESHDYGADLILRKHREKIVVQAKRYHKNVGLAAVQEAIGAIAYYEADRAMVVTNRYFTRSAKDLAQRNDVDLWGREEIIYNFRIQR